MSQDNQDPFLPFHFTYIYKLWFKHFCHLSAPVSLVNSCFSLLKYSLLRFLNYHLLELSYFALGVSFLFQLIMFIKHIGRLFNKLEISQFFDGSGTEVGSLVSRFLGRYLVVVYVMGMATWSLLRMTGTLRCCLSIFRHIIGIMAS